MEYHVAKDPAHKNCVHRYSWRVEIVASSWALQSSELGTELTSSELLSLIPSSKKMDLPQLYLQGTPTEPASLRVPVLVTEEGMFFFKPYFLPIRAACATVKSANSSQIFMFRHIFCTLIRSLTFEIWMKSEKIPILYRDILESAAAWSQHMLFSYKT